MKQMKQMKQQSGFTLVELVTTMVIVGTLAAVAVPKFADAAKDARITKLESLRGSVITAAAATRNAAQTRGAADTANCASDSATADNSLTSSGTVCTEHGIVTLAHGYPVVGEVGATTYAKTGIINVTGLTSTFRPQDVNIVKAGFGVAISGVDATFSVIGGSGTESQTGTTAKTSQTNSKCSFTYTQANTRNTPPNISEIVTSGC